MVIKKADLIVHARWLLPIRPQHEILHYYSLVVHQKHIIDIDSTEVIKQKYTADVEEDLSCHVLLPGLINAHTHSPMTLFRGMADDLSLLTWLNDYIWPAEQACLNEDFVIDGTWLAIAEMLRSGTTCFNEHYFYPHLIAETAIHAGMRAVIGMTILDSDSSWAKGEMEHLEKSIKILEEFKPHPLIKFSFGAHSPYMVSDNGFKAIRAAMKKYQIPLYLHTHESADSVNLSLEKYKKRPLQRLYDLGLLENKVLHTHMTQMNDEDLKILQQCENDVIHCPQSNLKLNNGSCPVQKLLDAGINVALGTDSCASNNDLDMFDEMRTAALKGKIVANDASKVSAATVLEMATINGAKALGLENEIGSLEIGKSADFIAVNLKALNSIPVYNPMSQLVYAVNSRQVTDSWIRGKRLLKNGEFTEYDTTYIIDNAIIWSEKIKQILKNKF